MEEVTAVDLAVNIGPLLLSGDLELYRSDLRAHSHASWNVVVDV